MLIYYNVLDCHPKVKYSFIKYYKQIIEYFAIYYIEYNVLTYEQSISNISKHKLFYE